MKKVIVEELNCLNIFLILIFRFFGFKVFFYKITNFLRNQKLILILKKIEILKIDFNNEIFSINNSYNKCKENSISQANLLTNKTVKKIWTKKLEKIFLNQTYLKILLFNHYKYQLWQTYVLFEYGKKIQKKNERIFFWLNKELLTLLIIKEYKNFEILKPTYLNNFSYLINILHLLKNKIIRKFQYTIFKKNKKKKSINDNITNLKTLFFVSGGIVNANSNYLDKKNFFFSEDRKDPLNKNNIKVYELNQNLDRRSLSYYEKYKIDCTFWFQKKISSPVREKFFLLTSLLIEISLKFDLKLGSQVYIFALNILENLKRLDDHSNLKNAIIENEFQFPTTLAIALKHKKVKITCFAKRLIYTAQVHQVIIDNYFIIGDKTLNNLKSQLYKNINPIIVGGVESLKQKNLSKYLLNYKKKYALTCLVLDYHSDKNWYKSSLDPIVNWSNNLKFYTSILKISISHPKILFVLKSKNYDWIKIPHFKNIYRCFKKQKNVIFFKKNYQITNYQMIQNVDFSIAKYTSLVDDFLMNHKPVIICEDVPFVKDFIKYDKSIVVEDYKTLDQCVLKLESNFSKFNSSLNLMRKKYFKQFYLPNFQKKLRKILK